VLAPTTVDFDHIGDTSKFDSMIRHQRKEQIEFNMNLRRYKQLTNFVANDIWHNPLMKQHNPHAVLAPLKEISTLKVKENKYRTGVNEPNSGALLHLLPKKGTLTDY
jgi:hypothetical protein